MWRRNSVGWGLVASLALHGAWIGTLGNQPIVPTRRAAPIEPRAAYELAFEPLAGESDERAAWRARPQQVTPGGARSANALDADDQSGRGGDGRSDDPPALLFSFASSLTLQDTDLNNLRTSQTQRIETARSRATQEERRASPNAADAVFLASGSAGHRERRVPALVDPGAGAPQETQVPSQRAARGDGEQRSESIPDRAVRTADQDVARGIQKGRGQRSRLSARVDFGRPNVDRGPAATPAEVIDAKVRDNVDAELLAAALQRSIVDASTQRALARAAGTGGADDLKSKATGLTGEGLGSRATPFLPGAGSANALDTSDARYVRWFAEQKQRVQSELTFPHLRALTKDQGVSIYRVIVRRDGRLAAAPHLVRSSGYSDFDAAAIAAIQRAVPFSPLPERLAPNAEDLTLLIPVAFSNPMVQ